MRIEGFEPALSSKSPFHTSMGGKFRFWYSISSELDAAPAPAPAAAETRSAAGGRASPSASRSGSSSESLMVMTAPAAPFCARFDAAEDFLALEADRAALAAAATAAFFSANARFFWRAAATAGSALFLAASAAAVACDSFFCDWNVRTTSSNEGSTGKESSEVVGCCGTSDRVADALLFGVPFAPLALLLPLVAAAVACEEEDTASAEGLDAVMMSDTMLTTLSLGRE